MQLVNFNLMRHPMNWATIWLMLFLAGFALHLVMQGLGIRPPNAQPSGYAGAPSAGVGTGAAVGG